MKKYYDIPGDKLVAMLDWKPGHGDLEQAKKYLGDDNIREITKTEFNRLGEEYASGNK